MKIIRPLAAAALLLSVAATAASAASLNIILPVPGFGGAPPPVVMPQPPVIVQQPPDMYQQPPVMYQPPVMAPQPPMLGWVSAPVMSNAPRAYVPESHTAVLNGRDLVQVRHRAPGWKDVFGMDGRFLGVAESRG